MYKQELSPEQALQKLRHFCAYQERCHAEVKDKLYNLGVRARYHDDIMASLISDNYLNEERFAIAYAGGKWRIKHWGRNRIRYELKQRDISEYCIKKAMKQIDEGEYLDTLSQLAREKYQSLKSDQYIIRKKKTTDFLVQRGFEPGLARQAVDALQKGMKG